MTSFLDSSRLSRRLSGLIRGIEIFSLALTTSSHNVNQALLAANFHIGVTIIGITIIHLLQFQDVASCSFMLGNIGQG